MKQFATIALLFFLFFAGCATTQNRLSAKLDSPFGLTINQTGYVDSENLQIRILNITDSRCPSDVQCIWAGEVNVRLVIIPDDGVWKGLDLKEDEEKDFSSGNANYSVRLLEVRPYPISTQKIEMGDYVLTLLIRRT